MNIPRKDFENCEKLKEYLEQYFNKEIKINEFDEFCEIKEINKEDEKKVLNILDKKKIKISPLFYK
jgi:GTP-binding protein EngB required for normal cell division